MNRIYKRNLTQIPEKSENPPDLNLNPCSSLIDWTWIDVDPEYNDVFCVLRLNWDCKSIQHLGSGLELG